MANLCITSCRLDSLFITWAIPFTIEPLELKYPLFVIMLKKAETLSIRSDLNWKGYCSYFWNWHAAYFLSAIFIDDCYMVIYASWPVQSLLVEARYDIASVVIILIRKYNCFGCSLIKSLMICSCCYFFGNKQKKYEPTFATKETHGPWLPTFSTGIFIAHGPSFKHHICYCTFCLFLDVVSWWPPSMTR